MKPLISLLSSIKNRAHLLEYSLQSIAEQDIVASREVNIEYNIGDSRSDDHLDEVLEHFSGTYGWVINKLDNTMLNNAYKPKFNCPAAKYNALVAVCNSEYVVKFDPEFVFITPSFFNEAMDVIREQGPRMVMPLPHHVHEFDYQSVEGIRQNFKQYKYDTHINEHTAKGKNVYYGCMFRRSAYLDLGGIDIRFLGGIGSEDDHLMQQWRRKYGDVSVVTLLHHAGVHLWHGEWGKRVPQNLFEWVHKNGKLKKELSNTYPNNGDFDSIKYPPFTGVRWEKGQRVAERFQLSVGPYRSTK